MNGMTRRTLLQNGLAGATLLSTPSVLKARDRNEITIGYFISSSEKIEHPDRLDWVASANMVSTCLEPLARLGGENHLEYVLATNIWSEPSGMVWYINVRPNVYWLGGHSSERLTPQHVVANIRHWIDDELSTVGNQLRGQVEDVAALPNGSVRIQLNQPNHHLLYAITSYPALIMHPGDEWHFGKDTKRTGPFKLTSFVSTQEARYEPESQYWNSKARAERPILFLQDSSSSDGSFDFLPQMDPDKKPAYLGNGIRLKQNALADALIFHMDCTDPDLKDIHVRQALRSCMNPTIMIESINGYGREADHTHVSPIHRDFDGINQAPSFDLERAKKLIGGRILEFPIHYQGENAWQRNAVKSFSAQAKEAGILLTPTPIARERFDKEWADLPGLTTIKWNHRPLGMQLYREVYHSKSNWNLSSWSNEAFDRHVEILYQTPLEQTETISRHMSAARQILRDDGPFVQAAWLDCNKAYNANRLTAKSVQVGAGGHIYANLLRTV